MYLLTNGLKLEKGILKCVCSNASEAFARRSIFLFTNMHVHVWLVGIQLYFLKPRDIFPIYSLHVSVDSLSLHDS